METKEVRRLIQDYGEFCSFSTDEMLADDTPSDHADNYICYTELLDQPKPVSLPPVHYGKPDLSFMKDYAGYLEFGNHIPIPCLDFFVRSVGERGPMYLLLKRGIWPMYGRWWPIGGRRFLPDFSGPIQPYWTRAHEIVRKLGDDLGLLSTQIKSVCKVSSSDHYHLAYESACKARYASRRVTPVTSFVVDISENVIHGLGKPGKEALELAWFSEEELIEHLDSDHPDFPDHLRIILSVVLRREFQLRDQTELERRIA